MHIFRMLRGRESPVVRREPQAVLPDSGNGRTSSVPLSVQTDPIEAFGMHRVEGDLRGSEAIFDLIGSRPVQEQGAASQSLTRVDGDDLIAGLHRQYCQALDNPYGSESVVEWELPTELVARAGQDLTDLSVESNLHGGEQSSIEALLSGAQLLDHAFGSLVEGDLAGLPAHDPAPEILRLFAPPEYQTSAYRSVVALPPALARREHHSLSIDSPLPVPEVTLTGESK